MRVKKQITLKEWIMEDFHHPTQNETPAKRLPHQPVAISTQG